MAPSMTTIASGLLSLVSAASAVKYTMDIRKMTESGEDASKISAKKNIKYAFAVASVVFGGVFVYGLVTGSKASGSFLSSMAHSESDAEFAKRVSVAAEKLREKINNVPSSSSSTFDAAITSASSSADLAASASAEISSFIANHA